MIVQDKTTHEFYMKRCIELALMAKQRGDSPVGSLIVKDGKIISEGVEGGKTFGDITCHAEIEAIRHATKLQQSPNLSGCTLYTTHEPCIMCAYVIRHHKINTVVMALTTGEIGGFSSKFPVLIDETITKWKKPPVVFVGILEEECKILYIKLTS